MFVILLHSSKHTCVQCHDDNHTLGTTSPVAIAVTVDIKSLSFPYSRNLDVSTIQWMLIAKTMVVELSTHCADQGYHHISAEQSMKCLVHAGFIAVQFPDWCDQFFSKLKV